MFSINKFNGLEIYLHKATKSTLEKYKVNNFQGLIFEGVCLKINCESNQKLKSLAKEESYNIVNEIIQYKGDDFLEELFSKYERILTLITAYKFKEDEENMRKIKRLLANLITFIDTDFIHEYITKIKPISIPSRLPENFDKQNEIDGIGSEDQTYTKSSYLDLITLIIIMKFIYPLIEEIFKCLEDNKRNFLNMQMLDFLKEFSICQLPGFIKLQKYINKILSGIPDDEINIKVLTIKLSENLIPVHYLSELLFGKMIFSDLEDGEKIVTSIYGDIQTKLKNNGDSANRIRNKTKPRESEDSNVDKGSVMESFRQSTKVTKGKQTELNFVTGNMDILLKQRKFDIDLNDVDYAVKTLKDFQKEDLSIIHLNLLSCFTTWVYSAKGLKYTEFEPIKNLLAVSYAILKKVKCEPIAYIMLSKKILRLEDEEFDIHLNFETNQIKGYREDELINLCSIKRIISERNKKGEIKYEYVILSWINDTAEAIKGTKWIPPIGVSVSDILVPDLKSKLADALIRVNALVNYNKVIE